MNVNRLAVFFMVSLISPLNAFALNGGPKPPPPAVRPTPFPKVTCANVMTELQKLKGMSSEQSQAVASFMDEVVVTMDGWHRDLVNYEGKTTTFKVGEFAAIKKQTEAVTETQGLVWDNLNIVDARFDEVLEILPSCLKTAN